MKYLLIIVAVFLSSCGPNVCENPPVCKYSTGDHVDLVLKPKHCIVDYVGVTAGCQCVYGVSYATDLGPVIHTETVASHLKACSGHKFDNALGIMNIAKGLKKIIKP